MQSITMGTKSEYELDSIMNKYEELITSLKVKFPKTDLRLVFQLMSHELLHPNHEPTLEIEIFYKTGVDLKKKVVLLTKLLERFSKLIDRVPRIYASENRIIIDPRLKLKDISAFVQDDDIESFAGDVVCCTDSLLGRRKYLV